MVIGGLTGRRAGLGLGRHVGVLLDGALLDRDLLAAQAVRRQLLRVALLHQQARAGGEVGDEVDRLLALLAVGEGREAEVVLARREARDDAGEVGLDDVDLQAQRLADRVGEVDVHADDRLVVRAEELVRRVRRVGRDRERALALDRGRHRDRESAEALGTVLGCVLDPLLLLPQAASARARLAAVPTAAERFTRLVRDATWSPSDDGDGVCRSKLAGNIVPTTYDARVTDVTHLTRQSRVATTFGDGKLAPIQAL